MRIWPGFVLLMMPVATAAGAFPETRARLDSAVARAVADADRNRDGRIDRTEVAAALGIAQTLLARRTHERPLFALDTGPDGRPRLSLSEDGPLGQGGILDTLYRGIDRNRDDLLSPAEVQAAARARFDAADQNRDGALDPAEQAIARQQLAAIRQAIGR